MERKYLRGFRRDDVHPFRSHRSNDPLSQCPHRCKTGESTKRRTVRISGSEAALTREQLDARILREFEAGPNKQFKNVIGVLFPSSLTPVMLELGGIPAEKKIHDISREERQHFIDLIKAFPFTITGMGEFKEAIITRGGVSVKEINPGTMESKKISGLYFAGEVLDLDAVTGGYNLQIAWSTAYLAAQAIRTVHSVHSNGYTVS